jgi:Zn-dependent protease with chaperone function
MIGSGPTAVAVALAVPVALLCWPAPALMARAARSAWALRAPRATTAAWAGYAVGSLAVSLAPWVFLVPRVVPRVVASVPRDPVAHNGGSVLAGVALAVAVQAGIAVSAATRRRARHARALSLVGVWDPRLRALVVEDPRVLAYCVSGARSRPTVVVTAGLLQLADGAELRAILAHERAHARARHHQILLAFAAWQAVVPFLPQARVALDGVRLATEAWADDVAARTAGPRSTISALYRVGSGVPQGCDTSGWTPDPATLLRIRRLLRTLPDGRRFNAASEAA